MAGASGAVRAALCSLITGYDHLDGVQRSKAAKDDVRKTIIGKDSCVDTFDGFSTNLVRELEKCCCCFFLLIH